ncbi:clathrin interactor EPSIN 1-like [Dioscorea cayenensis subsp. rotundata]|uniref:Clathrin interactor EPSIN 1-like n=1 Tax=Dioscorea cayennensis subsp. rotundata TaxID=55577 RepID=A0AB40CTR1_DIOCR|nr:clathrin interactor EPSIN 1-like [Dioscorea cayenensis subsp. rotundata]
MDFMKVWDQAVREIKREVNLKVLKVPEIEQKVLDATSDEPWGPHGTALSEIAQATKKFTECQLVMNVLWNRLMDTGQNWRHVYKALSVIEYLVANGSESALNDILEHSYQISSISGFEYVEPNGKDVGINVRKKVETILALLDDRERIQAARDKATANREKYFGLSSTGITYKSSSASYGSDGFYGTYHGGASGSKETGSFKGSSPDRDRYGYPVSNYHKKDGENKSNSSLSKENEGIKVKKVVSGRVRDQDSLPSIILKPSIKPTLTPKSSSTQPSSNEDDFDDFDPRGYSASASTSSNSNQVDLFAQSMIGDLMDASAAIPKETTSVRNVATLEVDLFAEATFISASPQSEAASVSHSQGNVDFFACQSDFNNAVNQNIDFFAASNPDVFTKNNESSKLETANIFDPFVAVPLNNSEESDLFGVFTAHSDPVSSEHTQNSSTKVMDNSEQVSSPVSKPTPKKDTSQIKSAIWADSLSRGLIDFKYNFS